MRQNPVMAECCCCLLLMAWLAAVANGGTISVQPVDTTISSNDPLVVYIQCESPGDDGKTHFVYVADQAETPRIALELDSLHWVQRLGQDALGSPPTRLDFSGIAVFTGVDAPQGSSVLTERVGGEHRELLGQFRAIGRPLRSAQYALRGVAPVLTAPGAYVFHWSVRTAVTERAYEKPGEIPPELFETSSGAFTVNVVSEPDQELGVAASFGDGPLKMTAVRDSRQEGKANVTPVVADVTIANVGKSAWTCVDHTADPRWIHAAVLSWKPPAGQAVDQPYQPVRNKFGWDYLYLQEVQPGMSGMLGLNPGEKRSIQVNLNQYFTFYTPGEYRIMLSMPVDLESNIAGKVVRRTKRLLVGAVVDVTAPDAGEATSAPKMRDEEK